MHSENNILSLNSRSIKKMSPRIKENFEKIRREKRALIIEVAVKLFSEKGFHATTVDMISRKAGISKGLLYNYYKSKEDLLAQIMYELSLELMDLMNPDHDDEITSSEMKDFFTFLIDLLKRKTDHIKLYFELSLKNDIYKFVSQQVDIEQILKEFKLIKKYFEERFENSETELTIFISVLKGFALEFVTSPDSFEDQRIENFKNRLFDLFIRDKKEEVRRI